MLFAVEREERFGELTLSIVVDILAGEDDDWRENMYGCCFNKEQESLKYSYLPRRLAGEFHRESDLSTEKQSLNCGTLLSQGGVLA